MLYKERAEQAEKIDALAAENAKLRERVAELEEEVCQCEVCVNVRKYKKSRTALADKEPADA